MARKRYQGASNDKERSKKLLVEAVGRVIKNKGYTGLTATNIANEAGLSRRLISIYFESVDNLVKTYIRNQDYWVGVNDNTLDLNEKEGTNSTKPVLEKLLIDQFEYFYSSKEMQKIILWQLSERSDIMYEVCEEREELSKLFFSLSDKEKHNETDIRAIAALLVGGIYYTVLHSKMNDSLFCEIDMNELEGKERIKNAIKDILRWAYDNERT